MVERWAENPKVVSSILTLNIMVYFIFNIIVILIFYSSPKSYLIVFSEWYLYILVASLLFVVRFFWITSISNKQIAASKSILWLSSISKYFKNSKTSSFTFFKLLNVLYYYFILLFYFISVCYKKFCVYSIYFSQYFIFWKPLFRKTSYYGYFKSLQTKYFLKNNK